MLVLQIMIWLFAKIFVNLHLNNLWFVNSNLHFMSEDNVAIRLKLFIETEGLTYSQFADTCGIPRPSLSQLLTGRNKKISDILVGQIHKSFPQLSIMWLLFGEGNMLVNSAGYNSVTDEEGLQGHSSSAQNSDFDFSGDGSGLFADFESPQNGNRQEIPTDGQGNIEFSKENGLSQAYISVKNSENEIAVLKNTIRDLKSQLDNLRQNPRKVVQIMVYYDDSTFETFIPNQ